MKKILEEFLMVDKINLKAVVIITVGTFLSFPIGYWIVFAPPLWWQ